MLNHKNAQHPISVRNSILGHQVNHHLVMHTQKLWMHSTARIDFLLLESTLPNPLQCQQLICKKRQRLTLNRQTNTIMMPFPSNYCGCAATTTCLRVVDLVTRIGSSRSMTADSFAIELIWVTVLSSNGNSTGPLSCVSLLT